MTPSSTWSRIGSGGWATSWARSISGERAWFTRLQQGAWLSVVTRGAGNSQGKTSWSAKPERQDYISFIGLFAHYLHALDPRSGPSSPCPPSPGNSHLLSPLSASSPSSNPSLPSPEMALIVGGYSYGSLVVTHLPPLAAVLAPFAQPAEGTAAAEIRLRAAHLAGTWNEECATRRRGRAGAVHGGEEGEPGARRSRESSRRSVEGLRRSVERTREKFSQGRHRSNEATTETKGLEVADIRLSLAAYLLVSPLLPPVSSFLTMFARHKPSPRKPKEETPEADSGCGEVEVAKHPTLVVHGDDDLFTSSKKLRKWTVELAAWPGSQLRSVEVPDAGHFWHDPEAQRQLVEAVDSWTRDLPKS